MEGTKGRVAGGEERQQSLEGFLRISVVILRAASSLGKSEVIKYAFLKMMRAASCTWSKDLQG